MVVHAVEHGHRVSVFLIGAVLGWVSVRQGLHATCQYQSMIISLSTSGTIAQQSDVRPECCIIFLWTHLVAACPCSHTLVDGVHVMSLLQWATSIENLAEWERRWWHRQMRNTMCIRRSGVTDRMSRNIRRDSTLYHVGCTSGKWWQGMSAYQLGHANGLVWVFF